MCMTYFLWYILAAFFVDEVPKTTALSEGNNNSVTVIVSITPYLCVLLIALPSFVGRCIELTVINHTTVEEKAK